MCTRILTHLAVFRTCLAYIPHTQTQTQKQKQILDDRSIWLLIRPLSVSFSRVSFFQPKKRALFSTFIVGKKEYTNELLRADRTEYALAKELKNLYVEILAKPILLNHAATLTFFNFLGYITK